MSPNFGRLRLIGKIMKGLSVLGLVITLGLSFLFIYLGISGDQNVLANFGLGLYFIMAGNTTILIIGLVLLALGLMVTFIFYVLGAVLETLASVDENTRYFLMTLQQQEAADTQPVRAAR